LSVRDEILEANAAHTAAFGARGDLARAPARKVAVLMCMDARLDPARFAGLGEGDACVIRNAGGRASDDAIRSLVVSHKLLGTSEWFVIHHSDCGMEVVTNELMGDLFAQSLDSAAIGPDGFYDVGEGPGSPEGRNIDWLPISDRQQSVVDDVRTIRDHPLVSAHIAIYGFVYDVTTGRLLEVPEATEAGRPGGGHSPVSVQ
jgi:carbonic anhydrase